MQGAIIKGVISQLDAIECAEAVLVKAVNADVMESKLLIEAAIYIIGQAAIAVRELLEGSSEAA